MVKIIEAETNEFNPLAWALAKPHIADYGAMTKALAEGLAEEIVALKAEHISQIQELQKEVEALKAGPKKTAPTYASTLAKVNLGQPKLAPANGANLRRLTYLVKNEVQRKEAESMTPEQLLDAFRGGNANTKGDVVAAFYKPTEGAVVLSTTTVAAREKIERENGLASEKFNSATLKRKSLPVRVHGFRLGSINEANQLESIQRILDDNAKIHPDLKILGVRWPKSATRKTTEGNSKFRSTLHIEVAKTADVNRLVDLGLLDGAALLSCERWAPGLDLEQCFNCQDYGHKAPTCKNKAACAYCAGDHQTREHRQDHGIARCHLCKGTHVAFSPKCPIRQREKNSCQQRRRNKAPKFGDTTSETITRSVDNEGFELVEGKKKRKIASPKQLNTLNESSGDVTMSDETPRDKEKTTTPTTKPTNTNKAEKTTRGVTKTRVTKTSKPDTSSDIKTAIQRELEMQHAVDAQIRDSMTRAMECTEDVNPSTMS